MPAFLGIDTSNYRTSVALLTDSGEYISKRKLLEVAEGGLGLRQSEALFMHVRDLPSLVEEALQGFGGEIAAVGVSSKPREQENSYMPCFLAGVSAARSVAAALKVPCFEFSHQSGHIAAALHSFGGWQLAKGPFLAYHISGGTTEAVLVTPYSEKVFKCEIVGGSNDLKIGQAVDRLGVALGLSFPAGEELDRLASSGELTVPVNPKVNGTFCSVSGLQNKCEAMLKNGESAENTARFIFEYISKLLKLQIIELRKVYGNIPIVFAGGVTANSIIRQRLQEEDNIFFATNELSGDNAVGAASLAKMRYFAE